MIFDPDKTYYLTSIYSEEVGKKDIVHCHVYADAARTQLIGTFEFARKGQKAEEDWDHE